MPIREQDALQIASLAVEQYVLDRSYSINGLALIERPNWAINRPPLFYSLCNPLSIRSGQHVGLRKCLRQRNFENPAPQGSRRSVRINLHRQLQDAKH